MMRPRPALLIVFALFGLGSLCFAEEPVKVGDFEFQFASPWSKGEPSSGMVKAVAEITPEGTAEALGASFYYFGAGQGGSAAANVERWVGQFEGEPAVESKKVKFGETTVTVLHIVGTYLSGSPFGAKTPVPDSALLGAIIEGQSAPVFVKMTGPQGDVEKAEAAFMQLVGSAFEGVEPEAVVDEG